MKKFLKQMLSGDDGIISSKRSMLFLLTLLFVGIVISNHITGKALDDTLKWQLFGLLIWLISTVFGEQIPDILKTWKLKPDDPQTKP